MCVRPPSPPSTQIVSLIRAMATAEHTFADLENVLAMPPLTEVGAV